MCHAIGADFSEADLGAAHLFDCLLHDIVAVNASFAGANCFNSSFRNADLRGADFRNADLRSAVFIGAKLAGASWDGARLEGARFDPGSDPRR